MKQGIERRSIESAASLEFDDIREQISSGRIADLWHNLSNWSTYDTFPVMSDLSVAPAGFRLRQFPPLLVCVACALPLPGWIFPQQTPVAAISRELLFWAMTGCIAAYVLLVERRLLSSIGIRRASLASFAFGVGGAVISYAGMAIIYVALLPHFDPGYASKISGVQTLPVGLRLAIVVRAAVFEEIFYRGFMIERLTPMLRSPVLAALASWAAFTVAHVGYWGIGSILIAGFGGAVLTTLYVWRRDLISNMIAHGLTDAISILL